jgi:hypothetical protein
VAVGGDDGFLDVQGYVAQVKVGAAEMIAFNKQHRRRHGCPPVGRVDLLDMRRLGKRRDGEREDKKEAAHT